MQQDGAISLATIEAWRRGEEQAVRAVFGVYYPRAVRLAALSGLGVEGAQDCAQEAFVHAYQRRGQLRDAQAFPLWFHRIVTRHALDALNVRQRGREVGLEAAEELVENWHRQQVPQPDELAIIAEQGKALWNSVQALAPRQRVALVLRYYGGFSLREVASMMGMREGALRVTIHRAVQRLRVHADDGPVREHLAALG